MKNKLLAGLLPMLLTLSLFSCGGSGGDSSTGSGSSATNAPGATPPADTTVPVTAASPVGGIFNAGLSVTLTSSEAATIYYTKDGSTPVAGGATTLSGASPVADIPILPGPATLLRYFAIDSAGNQEAMRSQTYSIVPLTTANPPGGNGAAPTVILTTSVPATIYYTTNGADPTTSSLHGASPVLLTGISTILKFFAVDAGNTQEALKTENYGTP